MLEKTARTDLTPEPADELTVRERQIAALAGRGLSNKAIACEANLTVGTVKVHLHRVFQKLGVGSRAMLVARASGIGARPLVSLCNIGLAKGTDSPAGQ